MRLLSLRIQNFRSFQDETIEFAKYSCFVGPNGSGKSTVLTALNVFFRNAPSQGVDLTTLTEEDFHHRNTAEPVRITLTFGELNKEAEDDFKDYARQGHLVVTARADWDAVTRKAPVVQHGERLGNRAFAEFFTAVAQNAKVAELREAYEGLRKTHSDLPARGPKQAMIDALHGYEGSHIGECELLESEDQFYGFTRGANRLAKHVQWVYVPAVKDAYGEQAESRNTALGELLGRTIRGKVNFKEDLDLLRKEAVEEYRKVVNSKQGALAEVSRSLERRLREWAHEGAELRLDWHCDPEKAVAVTEPTARAVVGEDLFAGEVVRLGHGLQRAFILTLLQELAGCDDPEGPRLLLGIEEPELYQHPPQARYFALLLATLSEGNAQVIVTTHSPYFVSARRVENLRKVCKCGPRGASRVSWTEPDRVANRLAKAMGCEPWPSTSVIASVEPVLQPSQAELFFCSCAVLVEGLEDLAFVTAQLEVDGRLVELRRLGCHFVVAEGKANMGRLVAIAKELEIPVMVICDGDNRDTSNRASHGRNNVAIQRLLQIDDPEEFPVDTLWHPRLVMWPSTIGTVLRSEMGEDGWSAAVADVRDRLGLVSAVSPKNSILIAAVVEQLANQGVTSRSLCRISESVPEFAASHRVSRGGENAESSTHS